jgi:hypothetical protein
MMAPLAALVSLGDGWFVTGRLKDGVDPKAMRSWEESCERLDPVMAHELSSNLAQWEAALVEQDRYRCENEMLKERVRILEESVIHPQEAIAWRCTGEGLIPYITQRQYERFTPAVQAWYEPFHCESCRNRKDSP